MNHPKQKNRAVNTDSITSLDFNEYEQNFIQSGKQLSLKERRVPHLKIKATEELNLFYILGKEIGQGGFGTVVTAKEIQNDKDWAIKIVVKSMAGSHLKFIQREIQILKLVSHPHIIHLDKIYESPRKIYMIFELCHSELLTVFNQQKPFSEEISRNIMEQILGAVAYLHKHDIVHRDLKMENILLTANPDNPADMFYTKLTDFGLSIIKSGTGVENLLHERCGTVVYMSPEMITKDKYSQLCDVWACGVILFKITVGRYPFFSTDEKELLDMIQKAEPNYPTNMNDTLQQLIAKMLEKEPVRRFTAHEALGHPWVKGDSETCIPETILETMNKWRSEMMLIKDNSVDYFGSPSRTKLKREKSFSKQPVPITVTNIKFNNQHQRVSIEKIHPANVLPGMAEDEPTYDPVSTKYNNTHIPVKAVQSKEKTDRRHIVREPSRLNTLRDDKIPSYNNLLLPEKRKSLLRTEQLTTAAAKSNAAEDKEKVGKTKELKTPAYDALKMKKQSFHDKVHNDTRRKR